MYPRVRSELTPWMDPPGPDEPCGIAAASDVAEAGMLKINQWTTGPLGGGTSISCSTSTNDCVLGGAPVQARAGDGAEFGMALYGAQVFSAGRVSPSLKPAAVSVKPGVGVPCSIAWF